MQTGGYPDGPGRAGPHILAAIANMVFKVAVFG